MFYSHELLGRKTPLGAIWTLAHGRKLSKGKIISINVREICDEIMQPGVPHSLRLQGILVGGVVMVFSKQQTYLLEDLQDMMRRVQAAASDASGARGTTKTEKGRGKGGKNADGNNQARLEAITMMETQDIMVPAAFRDDDILDLLERGSLSDALGSQGALPLGRRRMGGAALADDLFEMPSLGGGATSEGGGTDAQGRPVSSRGTRTASERQKQEQEEEVYGGAGIMHQDWLNVEDEVFADPEALDFDLLSGLDLPQAPASTNDRSRDQSTSQQHKQAASGDTTEPQSASAAGAAATAAAAVGRAGATGGVPYEFDDHMFVMEDQTQEVQHRADHEEEQDRESDQQQSRDQVEPEQGVEQVQRAKQRKRKAGNVVMDDLDNLLIKNKVYREWCANSSTLVNNQLKSGHPLQAHTCAATPLMKQDTSAGFGELPFAGFAGAAGGGVPLCAELLALFKAPEEAAAAEHNTGGGKGKPEQPGSPEVNNSTGEGSLPGMLPYAHKLPLDLHQVPDGDMMMMQGDPLHAHDDLNMMMAESPPQPHPEDQDMMMVNDEAHDMLGDLPFNGDIEVERMRAAATPGSSDGSLQNLLPVGASTAGRKMGSNVSGEGGSGLAAARAGLARELGGTGTKRRLGSADLGDADNLDVFFGTGNLADLLPDVEADQYYDEMQQHEEEGPAVEAAGPAAGRSGSLAGSDRSLTPYNSSQYPLLEETEPDQQTQLPRDMSALSGKTQLALSIFQQRLQRSAEQQAAAADVASVNDAAGAAAEPSVSFFGLIKEGRLSRNQAAVLFYQVCVTTTAGFVSASQERPYGDIHIKQGSREV